MFELPFHCGFIPLKASQFSRLVSVCKWWPLLYRIDYHTPGYRVHTFVFVTRFEVAK